MVLTFDDGPLPKYCNQILDILAAQCVKATFFLVGRQANANPEGVRKVRDAGHTVATHSQNHPSGMDRLPLDRARREIEQGIASVTAALADGTAPAPFLRIPGLRTQRRDRGNLPPPKDCRSGAPIFPPTTGATSPSQRVYELAIQRLEAKGKGILLLHDIQPRTVAALPRILHELESARLSHRPCGAGDAGSAGDADRAAAMAVASAVGDGGGFALAEDSEIRVCRPGSRSPPRRCPISIGTRPILAYATRGAGAAFPCHPAALWPRQTTLPPARHTGRAAGSGGGAFSKSRNWRA